MLFVLSIIGILANIAMPAVHQAKTRALAASVVADMNVIQTAILDYYAVNSALPASAGWGVVPVDLVPSLPNGFTFDDGTVRYLWFQWTYGGIQGIIAMQSADTDLLAAVKRVYGGQIFGGGTVMALIIR